MRMAVICNPASGRGRALRRAEQFELLASARGHQIALVRTREEARAAQIREEVGAIDAELIVSVGGDGTLNDIINSLEDPGRIPLTVLACGTANLLARELQIPLEPDRLLDMIERGEIHRFDLATLNDDRRALLVISAGFDAMVIDRIHHNRNGALGFRGYFKPVMSVLREYVPPRLRVTVDDQEPVEAQLVVASNIRHYAAFFSITERAEFDSGRFDVCAFHDASRWGILRQAIAARRRRISSLESVTYQSGTRIRIESDATPVPVEIDGEYFGTTPVDIRVEPRRVPILGPSTRP